MRRPLTVIALVAFVGLGLSACAAGAPADPEALGRRVLALLQADDFDGFAELALGQADYEAVMARATFKDEERRAMMAERGARIVTEAAANARTGWDKVRQKAAKVGIEWSETSFVRVESKVGVRDGIASGDIFVVIVFRGTEYKIKLDDCLKADRGWVLIDDMRLRTPSVSEADLEGAVPANPAAPDSGPHAP